MDENNLATVRRTLFYAALVPSVLQLFTSGYGFGHGYEMADIARNLVQTGSFADPFAIPTGPTAAEPPLYPLFIAGMMKACGVPLYVLVVTSFSITAQAAQIALLPRLSKLLFDNMGPGICGSILSLFAFKLMPQWDAALTALGLVVFCVFSPRIFQPSKQPVRDAIWTGLLAGLLFLLNASSILITVPWCFFLLLRSRPPARRAIQAFAAAILFFVLVVSPWLVRNYMVFGTFVVRSNLGMTLFTSNSDCAVSTITGTFANGCYASTHPTNNIQEAALVKQLGEISYDRRKTADALTWIRTHPAKFARLTRARAVEFWFPDADGGTWRVYVIWIITALSVPGLYLMYLRHSFFATQLIVIAVLYSAMYYAVVSDVRYRYPMLWMSALCAGYAVWHAWGWYKTRPACGISPVSAANAR